MSTSSIQNPRRGVILVIVVACLALFLTVGLAFVFYANQQAISMRYQREASNGGRAANVNQMTRGSSDEVPPQAVDLFNMALGQLIYGTPDSDPAANGYRNMSAMNGHDLARAMYGYNSTNYPNPMTPLGATAAIRYNTSPYTGFGRTSSTGSRINYVHNGSTVVRPEWESGSYISKNAPYTSPDANNCYLAAVDPKTGKVLVPSFHRPWLPGAGNWTGYNQSRLRANLADAPTLNADRTYGDVENLEGKQARQLDSMWIDLDAPVQTWRGRKYKPLFAFLVTDLDGRLNVNVAGNLKDVGNHASNQGWGPWEIDLDKVTPGQGANIVNRRYVNGQPNASLSTTGGPTHEAPGGTGAPAYSAVNFDASGDGQVAFPLALYQTSPTWSARYQGGNTTERTDHPLMYNSLLSDRFNSGSSRTPDKSFGIEEAYYLNNKYDGDTANYAKSILAKSSPPFLSIAAARAMTTAMSMDLQRPGGRAWPHGTVNYEQASAGVLPIGPVIASPSPGAAPANSDFETNSWRSLAASLGSIDLNRRLTDYRTTPLDPYEKAGNVDENSAVFKRAQNERQQLAMDIFRRLLASTGLVINPPPFPPIEPPTVQSNNQAQTFSAALPTADPKQVDACRRLAQIAVNIVDYIDGDDYITPFNWNPKPQYADMSVQTNIREGWVFGTEIPRLVINELYATWDNTNAVITNPPMYNDNGTQRPYAGDTPTYKYQIYVELHNPLTPGGATPDTNNLSHRGGAPLLIQHSPTDKWDVYRLVLTEPMNATKLTGNTVSDNVLGVTDDEYNGPPDLNRVSVVAPLGDVADPNSSKFKNTDPATMESIVVPVSNAQKGTPPADANALPGMNPSFYLVGPKRLSDLTAKLPGNNDVPLSYAVVGNKQLEWDIQAGDQPKPQTVLLRRLLCPHIKPSPTNPYITVDHMTMKNGQTQIWDHRKYLKKDEGMKGTNDMQKLFSEHSSCGRNQPYDARPESYAVQNQGNPPPPMPTDDAPINSTVYTHNSNAKIVFDWLVHLDRSLIGPTEISCVSAWKSHELTNQFVINGQAQQHLANWLDDGQRLYRAFSLLETRNRTYGMGFGGRIPGKVNINTMLDKRIFEAICDLHSGNLFTAADVDQCWNFINTRQKLMGAGGGSGGGTPPAWGAGYTPGQPFQPPLGAGHIASGDTEFPNGQNVRSTPLFIGLDAGQAQTHPYFKTEMLNKAYNNLTTRSNTFVVYCTIGYFEVDPVTKQLKSELGRDDGTSIRHKFFALVDRTNLTIDVNQARLTLNPRIVQGERPVFLSFEPKSNDLTQPDPDTTAVSTVTVRVPAQYPATAGTTSKIQGTYDGVLYTIDVGTTLRLDVGPNQEDVTVQSINMIDQTQGAEITINMPLRRPHARGCIMHLHPDRSTLGNPGPQPGFNYKDPRYAPVVPFVAQLN